MKFPFSSIAASVLAFVLVTFVSRRPIKHEVSSKVTTGILQECVENHQANQARFTVTITKWRQRWLSE